MLIEVAVAGIILTVSIVVLVLAFGQVDKTRLHNSTTGIGLTIINTQLDSDSRVPLDKLTDNDPPIDVTLLTPLSGSTLTRTVERQGTTSRVTYVLEWRSREGQPLRIRQEYILTDKGITND